MISQEIGTVEVPLNQSARATLARLVGATQAAVGAELGRQTVRHYPSARRGPSRRQRL